MAEKDEKKTVTPLPQVTPAGEPQGTVAGQGPLAPTEKELTPGQKVMSAAPWNPNHNPAAGKPQSTVAAAPAEGNKSVYNLATLYQNMVKPEDYGQPTPEQLEEERKRNKRNALLATIGDGLAAFHKAYSHARGVKPMELENLSDKMYNRMEKIRKEREANKLAYQNARMDQQAQAHEDTKAYREATLAENKRYHDALLGERGKDREAKQAMSEAANQLKESIEEKRQAAQDKRAAASNATKQSVAATQAAVRKEVASMKSGGSGGKGTQSKEETTTTYGRNGNVKKKIVKVTKPGVTNRKGSLLPGKK